MKEVTELIFFSMILMMKPNRIGHVQEKKVIDRYVVINNGIFSHSGDSILLDENVDS